MKYNRYSKIFYKQQLTNTIFLISLFIIISCLPLSCFHKRIKHKTYHKNKIGMKFVYVPKGAFMMGSPLSEPHRNEDERLHKVYISNPFFIQTTEVTQKQWKMVMGNNPSYFKDRGDRFPVENISWTDAQMFIRKLNKLENTKRYRLPTEAEWEYACRAGTKTPFTFGKCISTNQANYDGRYPVKDCPKGNFIKSPSPVETFLPNAWGVYDMHGNVYEWCQDRCNIDKDGYSIITNTYKDDQDNPISKIGRFRIIRGGSWYYSARHCRSAYRSYNTRNYRNFNLGFRLVASIEDS